MVVPGEKKTPQSGLCIRHLKIGGLRRKVDKSAGITEKHSPGIEQHTTGEEEAAITVSYRSRVVEVSARTGPYVARSQLAVEEQLPPHALPLIGEGATPL